MNKRDFLKSFEDKGIIDFGQILSSQKCLETLNIIRESRSWSDQLFRSYEDVRDNPQFKKVNPGRGVSNFAEKLDLSFIEKDSLVKETLDEILGKDYEIILKKFVVGVPDSWLPDWLKPIISKNLTANLGEYIKTEFRDVTYFRGIDFHMDLIDHPGKAGDYVTLYVYLDNVRLPNGKKSAREWIDHPGAVCIVPILDNGDILISLRQINLVAIIDRNTKKFSWERRDDSWGHQHDCQMLNNGNIMLFANGMNTAFPHSHSYITEFNPNTNEVVWEYRDDPCTFFYSHHISGAERLKTGNTLICEGSFGRIFEVTPEKEIVWEFINPKFDPMFMGDTVNWVFRAFRYTSDSPEIERACSSK